MGKHSLCEKFSLSNIQTWQIRILVHNYASFVSHSFGVVWKIFVFRLTGWMHSSCCPRCLIRRKRGKVVCTDGLLWMDALRSNFVSAIECFGMDMFQHKKYTADYLRFSNFLDLLDHGGLHNRVTYKINPALFALEWVWTVCSAAIRRRVAMDIEALYGYAEQGGMTRI